MKTTANHEISWLAKKIRLLKMMGKKTYSLLPGWEKQLVRKVLAGNWKCQIYC